MAADVIAIAVPTVTAAPPVMTAAASAMTAIATPRAIARVGVMPRATTATEIKAIETRADATGVTAIDRASATPNGNR